MYILEYKPSCKKAIKKACNKNPVLKKALQNKVQEILADPHRYKPLRHYLKGEYRVHVMKSFVLRYSVNEEAKTVILLMFRHHDDVYKR